MASRLDDIIAEPAVMAIDIPIGLPERAGPGGREAERAVLPRNATFLMKVGLLRMQPRAR